MTTDSSTALITGGTSGIGRATAKKLAQTGVHVVVVGRNVERGEKTVAEIRADADFISFDLQDASSAREVARRAVQLGNGHVDILINSAGVFPFGPTHEMTEEMFDSVYSINVKAPYFSRRTRSTNGEERQRGNRKCIDKRRAHCRLRVVLSRVRKARQFPQRSALVV
jgi:NAD(P)-dependent dehydrogenase (short-subunit alcohol dehydrogenase family)